MMDTCKLYDLKGYTFVYHVKRTYKSKCNYERIVKLSTLTECDDGSALEGIYWMHKRHFMYESRVMEIHVKVS